MKYMDEEYKRKLKILWDRTSINSETDCWEWQGTIDNGGYGAVTIDSIRYGTHVLSAILFLGYAQGLTYLQICHKTVCKSRNCWNPEHLYVGTATDNAHDRIEAGTQKNQHKDKTHCIRGHEFTPENTREYVQRNGVIARHCRECKRIREGKGVLNFKTGTE